MPTAKVETIPVTPAMQKAIREAINAALDYEKTVPDKRKLGITGEVGEVCCCKLLGLCMCVDPRSQGFDAMDSKHKRVQIKSRRSESSGLPRDAGRLGSFSHHEFDYALLVLMTHDYQVAEIWRRDYRDVIDLINRQKRRNPSIASFKSTATCVWRWEET